MATTNTQILVKKARKGFKYDITRGQNKAATVFEKMGKRVRPHVQKNIMAAFKKTAKRLGAEVVVRP